jgi:hypothetical protein
MTRFIAAYHGNRDGADGLPCRRVWLMLRGEVARARCNAWWPSVDDCTARWVDSFSHQRFHEYCGDIAPVDLETA